MYQYNKYNHYPYKKPYKKEQPYYSYWYNGVLHTVPYNPESVQLAVVITDKPWSGPMVEIYPTPDTVT